MTNLTYITNPVRLRICGYEDVDVKSGLELFTTVTMPETVDLTDYFSSDQPDECPITTYLIVDADGDTVATSDADLQAVFSLSGSTITVDAEAAEVEELEFYVMAETDSF